MTYDQLQDECKYCTPDRDCQDCPVADALVAAEIENDQHEGEEQFFDAFYGGKY